MYVGMCVCVCVWIIILMQCFSKLIFFFAGYKFYQMLELQVF